MKKLSKLLKILFSGTILAFTATLVCSCGPTTDVDERKDISSTELDKNLNCEAFFIPKDIENIETEDLLQINQDITVNEKILEILQKTFSPEISYRDFYLQNNAKIIDEYDQKIDYHVIQNIQMTVYSAPDSTLIKGNFTFDCDVSANKSKISLEEIFFGLEIDTIPVEIKLNNNDIIDCLTKDEWVKKHIFDILRTRFSHLNLNQLNFLFYKYSSSSEDKIYLEISPSESTEKRIQNNLLDPRFVYKTEININVYENDFFDLSTFEFTDFFNSDVEINTPTPELISKKEVISSILDKFPKSSIANFFNSQKKIEDKYKIFLNDVVIEFLNIEEKDSYLPKKCIEFNISFNSKYFFNKAAVFVNVLGVEKLNDLSLIKSDESNRFFEFTAKDPKNVQLNELSELLKPNSKLLNCIDNLISDFFKLTDFKLYSDYEIMIITPTDNMDFSLGKEFEVKVYATTFSKKLKNSFNFKIIGVVENYLTDISDVTIESRPTTYNFSSTNDSGDYVTKQEFEQIFKNKELNSFILDQILLAKNFPYLSSDDFVIDAKFDININYFTEQNIEITISSTSTSYFICGFFKASISVKANFDKYDLKNFDTSNAQTVTLDVSDPGKVNFSEAINELFLQKNFINTIDRMFANFNLKPTFGIDYTITIISIPADISVPGGFVKYQMISLKNSRKLTGENYLEIPIIGNVSQEPSPDKISNYSSENLVHSRTNHSFITSGEDSEKLEINCFNSNDFIFYMGFDYFQNKLWDKLNQTITMEYLLNDGIICQKERKLNIGVRNFSLSYWNIKWPKGGYESEFSASFLSNLNFANEIELGEKLQISAQLTRSISLSSLFDFYKNALYINLKLNKEFINFSVIPYAYVSDFGEITYMPKLRMINRASKFQTNFLLEFSWPTSIKTNFNPNNALQSIIDAPETLKEVN